MKFIQDIHRVLAKAGEFCVNTSGELLVTNFGEFLVTIRGNVKSKSNEMLNGVNI